jgi:hypothetical protein
MCSGIQLQFPGLLTETDALSELNLKEVPFTMPMSEAQYRKAFRPKKGEDPKDTAARLEKRLLELKRQGKVVN